MVTIDLTFTLINEVVSKEKLPTLPSCVRAKRSPHIENNVLTWETKDSEWATKCKPVSNIVKVEVLKISSA